MWVAYSDQNGMVWRELAPTIQAKDTGGWSLAFQPMICKVARVVKDDDDQTSLELTSSAGDSPARTSRWLDAVRDWMESDPDYSSSSCASLMRSLPVGFSSRTSLAFFHRTKDGTWERSSERWRTSGMGGPTGCLTHNSSAHPRDAVVCSLSDILEARVPPKYYLSPRACRGILRRAEQRGKRLPQFLQAALERRAREGRDSEAKKST